MVDTLDYGRRPLVHENCPRDLRLVEAMQVCPGIELQHTFDRRDPGILSDLVDGWGPVRQVWEGYAADPEIRHAGSSGGVATALALYCIEQAGMHGALHTAARPDVPYLNRTILSRTRAALLAATGSRYSPASPCDGLQRIEDAPAPCVFVGKPCDVAGVDKARRLRPQLDSKLGLTIAIFCAGTPTTRGTLALLQRMGVDDPSTVLNLRYRGHGWPGKTVLRVHTPEGEQERELTYDQSWGEVLTNHKQWRCKLCPDHTGEFADVSVGDPWHREPQSGEPGRSLIVARTRQGLGVLHAAAAAGYVTLDEAKPALLPASQPNLLRARGASWGRLGGLMLARMPRPRNHDLPTFRVWWRSLSLWEKAQSLVGTLVRIHRNRLWVRLKVEPLEAEPRLDSR